MNSIEKIMASHSNQRVVKPGDIIDVKLDWIMSNDATTTLAIDCYKGKYEDKPVNDAAKLVFVMDHYTPSSTVEAADTHNKMRQFAKQEKLTYVYDGVGVCHQIMMEKHVSPNQMIIGADSHTCTYGALGALSTGMGSTDISNAWRSGTIWMRVPDSFKIHISGTFPRGVYPKDLILKIISDLTADGANYKALYFCGDTIDAMGVSDRSTLCNMAIEAGAKFAYMAPNKAVSDFLEKAGRPEYPIIEDYTDAVYEKELFYQKKT